MKSQALARYLGIMVALALVSGCGGKLPQRGSPEFDERLRDREILIGTEDVEGTGLKVVRAMGWTDMPADVVWEVFQDFDSFDKFLYRVEESKELPPHGDKRVMRIVVNAPAIALTSGYDRIVMVAEIEESISADGTVRRGEFTSIQGNIKRAYGSWVVENYGPNGDETLVTFSMFIDFGKVYIPDDAANYFVTDFLERWGNNLREYAEEPNTRIKLEKAAALRKGKDPSEVGPKLDNIGDFLQ